jgi:hypothetical protein
MTELFEPVDNLPEYSTFYCRKTMLIKNMFDSFLSSNSKYGKVNLKLFNKKLSLIYTSLSTYARKHNYPIKILRRNNELYLTKT